MDLSSIPDELLIEELARRARKRAQTKPDGVPYCEECVHFRYFTGNKYLPNNYNPCGLKHVLALSGDFGFFRAVCEDRKERQT